MTQEERVKDIVESLKILGITADSLLNEIEEELNRGNRIEARKLLTFVDKLQGKGMGIDETDGQ